MWCVFLCVFVCVCVHVCVFAYGVCDCDNLKRFAHDIAFKVAAEQNKIETDKDRDRQTLRQAEAERRTVDHLQTTSHSLRPKCMHPHTYRWSRNAAQKVIDVCVWI